MSDLPFDFEIILKEGKEFQDASASFPRQNETIKLNATGLITNIDYLLDINRKGCKLDRITYNNRAYTTIMLLRLDIDTKPHKNPDQKKISGTHLHVYRENYGDAWAYELTDPILQKIKPGFDFTLLSHGDNIAKFYSFTNLCNITNHITFATSFPI